MINLSNSLTILCAVLVVVTCVVALVSVGIPALTKKGVNVGKYIKTADTVVDKASTIIKASDEMLPNNPIIGTIKLIEKWAQIGVNYAEQLYNTSQLEKDERNAKAKEQVYTVLKMLKIDASPEIDKIIDGAIEAEVLALGHKKQDNDINSQPISITR